MSPNELNPAELPSGAVAHVDAEVDGAGADAHTVRKLLASRWSCRAFRSDPVPQSIIEQILDIARRSPSWCNTQPWHLDILSGAATERLRKALAEELAAGPAQSPDVEFPRAYQGVYKQRRRESGWQLYDSLGIARDDRESSARQTLRNFDFFDAPHVAIVTTEADLGPYGALDCGIFVGNFLLAAHALGVATIPQAALASQAPLLRKHLDLAPGRQVLLGISFGYADDEHPVNDYRTSRQAVAEVATFHE